MTDEAMSVVLQSDHLNIDEMEIIEAVREWATVNSVSTRSFLTIGSCGFRKYGSSGMKQERMLQGAVEHSFYPDALLF